MRFSEYYDSHTASHVVIIFFNHCRNYLNYIDVINVMWCTCSTIAIDNKITSTSE